MKHTPSLLAPTLIASALSSQLAFASFTFYDNSGIAGAGVAYTVGGTETFTVDKPNVSDGITTDFSSNINGFVGTDLLNYLGVANPASSAHKKIWFENSEVVTAGTPMMFCFEWDVMLESPGLNPDGTGAAGTRLANELRWFEGTPALDVDMQMTGGNDTFQNYAGNPLTGTGSTHWVNPGILRSKGENTTFNGWGGTSDTANYTSPAIGALPADPITGIVPENFGVIGITDPNFGTKDSSFQQAYYTVTPQADLPVGTRFQFSFGGVEAVPVSVPEPGRAALLLIGLVGICAGRRRRRSQKMSAE